MLFVAATLALGVVGCNRESQSSIAVPSSTPVTVAKPVVMQIVEWDEYTGRLDAIDSVEVRARVSGYLESTHFHEGQMVNQGDLLAIIDRRPFQAELNGAKARLEESHARLSEAQSLRKQAQAEKADSDAQLTLANIRLTRAKKLAESSVISQDELDVLESQQLQASAAIEATNAKIESANAGIATATASIETARTNVESATLNLQYTQIRSPVSGRISRRYVTDGNLISGGSSQSTLLTTIVSDNPIHCYFDANERDVLKYIRLALSGARASSREAKNPVFLGLVDESGFPHEGHMDFVDNRFDSDTATMRARCIFSNDDQLLVPGMFARIRIPGSAPYRAVLIPDSAIGTDQSEQYVYIVVNNVIERRAIKPGPIVHGLRVVREGLAGEESLVIEGLLQSRPEMKVQTTEGSIEVVEDGLPNSYEPLPPEKWLSTEPDPLPESRETDTVDERKRGSL